MSTKQVLSVAIALTISSGLQAAENEYLFGGETKGAVVQAGSEHNMKMRIRLQPRVDYGDLAALRSSYNSDPTAKVFRGQSDMYLRRVRLELEGNLSEPVSYGLVIDADRAYQVGSKPTFDAQYAFFNYKHSDAFNVRFGKQKLPLTRVSLTSSSKQLLIERPVSTEAVKTLFGDYYQPHVMLHGKNLAGTVAYMFALADGANAGSDAFAKSANNSEIYGSSKDADKDTESGFAWIARAEFSPSVDWVEKGKSDAWLGQGQHLALGVDYGSQSGSKNVDSASAKEYDRSVLGIDLSGHKDNITLQAEYNRMTVKEKSADKKVTPGGWYIQAGYFIPGLNLEPVIRYEDYNLNGEISNAHRKYTTIGANWYAQGHSMKFGLNLVQVKFDDNARIVANDDSANVLQFQSQFYY